MSGYPRGNSLKRNMSLTAMKSHGMDNRSTYDESMDSDLSMKMFRS